MCDICRWFAIIGLTNKLSYDMVILHLDRVRQLGWLGLVEGYTRFFFEKVNMNSFLPDEDAFCELIGIVPRLCRALFLLPEEGGNTLYEKLRNFKISKNQ